MYLGHWSLNNAQPLVKKNADLFQMTLALMDDYWRAIHTVNIEQG